jgi:hypothetical protein
MPDTGAAGLVIGIFSKIGKNLAPAGRKVGSQKVDHVSEVRSTVTHRGANVAVLRTL